MQIITHSGDLNTAHQKPDIYANLPILVWTKKGKTKSKQVGRKLYKSCKFDPEGTRWPITPVDTVLEPWCCAHHACIKKFVDLTCLKSDIFRVTLNWSPCNKTLSSGTDKCFMPWAKVHHDTLTKLDPCTGLLSWTIVLDPCI